ncbi:MAG TPA: rod shape-determining protein [Pyrinomonadaceae bacterium]|jgi:rod shape-determining protein MreB|nr:rod shape-determining protein [Pyrinomonadaceae bacterium]
MSFIGKTSTFLGLNALRNLVSDSMAIDMGSARTIIAVRGRGIVVDEPSVVAVNKITGAVIAVGNEAHKMQGREARDVTVIAPLVDGVVADFERTRAMLDHFVREARSGISHFSRRAIMSVLSEVTQVEQRALLSAAEEARISRVYMIEEGQAAAIGAGVPITDERAAAVVDIGGGTTNVAAIIRGSIIASRAERIGSSDIDLAIMDRLRRHRGLTIGEQTAERLKLELSSAIEPEDPSKKINVRGRDVQTGSPGAVDITAGEVYTITVPIIRRVADEVRTLLADLSPEVAGDVYDRGLILTGGGAELEGLPSYLQKELGLAVRVAEDPRFAIVRGLSQLYEEPLLLRRVARTEPHALMDTEATAFET